MFEIGFEENFKIFEKLFGGLLKGRIGYNKFHNVSSKNKYCFVIKILRYINGKPYVQSMYGSLKEGYQVFFRCIPLKEYNTFPKWQTKRTPLCMER